MKKVLKYGFKKWEILWNFDFYTSHSSGFLSIWSQKKLGFYNLDYKISADYNLFYRMIIKEK